MKHTAEAQRLLDALDADLAHTAQKLGKTLSWTADEVEVRSMIGTTVDRRQVVRAAYEQVGGDDHKNLVRLSAELRLLDNQVERMLKALKVQVPQPMSLTSLKASRAARARWDKERGGATG